MAVPSILASLWLIAVPAEEAERPPDAEAPLEELPDSPGADDPSVAPVAPFDRPRALRWVYPEDERTPLDEPGRSARGRRVDRSEPLDRPSSRTATVQPARPLGTGPEVASERLDPDHTRLLRLDYLLGVVWRVRPIGVAMTTSVEYGRMQGLSGSFHTGLLISPDRNFVEVIDVPIGAGALYRHRFGERPLYGSVGLTAGILVHRADTSLGVIHRVDPDLRLPLRLAWTVGGIGASVALVPAYSIRERSYERRGARVWSHHSVRVGVVFGLHWDRVMGRSSDRWSSRRRGE